MRLANGHWLLVYNDAVEGRNSLAVSISEDEGVEMDAAASGTRIARLVPYPAVIEGADGTIHAVYSYFVDDGKSMKMPRLTGLGAATRLTIATASACVFLKIEKLYVVTKQEEASRIPGIGGVVRRQVSGCAPHGRETPCWRLLASLPRPR